jgi:hypothetical protein
VSAQNDAQHVKLADLVADGRAAPCQAPIEAAGQPGRTFPLRLRKVLAKAAIAASRNGRIAMCRRATFVMPESECPPHHEPTGTISGLQVAPHFPKVLLRRTEWLGAARV